MSLKISASKGARSAAKLHRAAGPSPDRALWLAVEVETLPRRYRARLQIGNTPLLASDAIERVRPKTAGHGHAHSGSKT
jgi:L-fuculose-phosphate aldolase